MRKTASIDFSAAPLVKPKVIRALSASCRAPVTGMPAITGVPSDFLILSLRSMMMRCADLGPMPLIAWMTGVLPVMMACSSSSGEREERAIRAVAGPIPFTDNR